MVFIMRVIKFSADRRSVFLQRRKLLNFSWRFSSQAKPVIDFSSFLFIVNGRQTTEDDPVSHAVVIFASTRGAPSSGALGGGSIISENAVLTAAHLVKE